MSNGATEETYYERRDAAAEALIRLLGDVELEALDFEYLEEVVDVKRLATAMTTLHSLAEEQEPESYEDSTHNDFMGLLARYADLDREERALKARLEEVKKHKVRLTGGDEGNGPLSEAWLNAGMQNITLKGRIFYYHTDRRLKRKPTSTPKEALTVLRRAGLGSLITQSANSNSLKSHLKDLEDAGKTISRAIAKHWEIFERGNIRSRKASAKKS